MTKQALLDEINQLHAPHGRKRGDSVGPPYEMMESYWPGVACGDEVAPPAVGDLGMGVQKLKDATPAGVLLGSGKLASWTGWI